MDKFGCLGKNVFPCTISIYADELFVHISNGAPGTCMVSVEAGHVGVMADAINLCILAREGQGQLECDVSHSVWCIRLTPEFPAEDPASIFHTTVNRSGPMARQIQFSDLDSPHPPRTTSAIHPRIASKLRSSCPHWPQRGRCRRFARLPCHS